MMLITNLGHNSSKRDKIILFVIIFFSAFSKNQFPGLPNGIMFSDIIIALFIVVFGTLQVEKLNLSPNWLVWMFLFLLWSLISAVYGIFFSSYDLSYIEYLKSFWKLAFYFLFALTFYWFVISIPLKSIYQILLYVLFLHSIIALYIFLAMSTNFELPYDFFWFGQGYSAKLSAIYSRYGSDLIVTRGIFGEPSTFGIFQCLGLLLLCLNVRCFSKSEKVVLTLIIFSLIMTLSISVLVLLFSIFFVSFMINKNNRLFFSFVFSITIALYFVFSIFSADNMFSAFMSRISSIFKGTDTSANLRLIFSWKVPLQLFKESGLDFLFGFGLGNHLEAHPELYHSLLSSNNISEGWNILAWITGSTGLIGIILFFTSLWFAFKDYLVLGLFFLLTTFASGNLLEVPFWMYLSLYSVVAYLKLCGHRSLFQSDLLKFKRI